MNNEIEEELRQSFKDETKNKLWSENGDNDCGFSEEYVFWLEKKVLNIPKISEDDILKAGEEWKKQLGLNTYRLYSNQDFSAGATWINFLLKTADSRTYRNKSIY